MSASKEGQRDSVRIIGGSFRGRKIVVHHRDETRPMKHRVREAAFNLIGPSVKGKHAIDLFAGSGALGLEALSRGAASAMFVERHLPTARILGENLAGFDVDDRAEVTAANAFVWARRFDSPPSTPWLVFCSPPYDFYVHQFSSMLSLIERLIAKAPEDSIFVVEADDRFDFANLRQPQGWDVRSYPPAEIGILRM